jgi:oxygen-independent coproporphyrinogen-3 oxidase
MNTLVEKYNVPGPRYTSYPTVPYWQEDTFSVQGWRDSVAQSFEVSNDSEGISLYIHLPFCEQMCTFCGCHKRITLKHQLESPYISALLAEWQLYLDLFETRPQIKELHLGGGTPTFFSPEHLGVLIEGIMRRAKRAPGASFSFEGHPNNTTVEHLSVLAQWGFDRVSFGVQDYNPTVQEAINRIQPFSAVKQVTEQARALGYHSVGHDLIYGLPHQELSHVQETIGLTLSLMPDRIALYSYAHVPWLKGNGQRGFSQEDLPTAAQKLAQYQWAKSALIEAGYTDIGMDHFALPGDSLSSAARLGQLHRNFMGYTAGKTRLMIGLGMSAISDSWGGFAQNEKNLEAYQHLVSQGIFPVFKGHLLSEEDLVVRQHILNLMTRWETSWEAPERKLDPMESGLPALSPMIADGLVTVTDDRLTIAPEGRAFVRNICMAFDLRLAQHQPDRPLFSMTV